MQQFQHQTYKSRHLPLLLPTRIQVHVCLFILMKISYNFYFLILLVQVEVVTSTLAQPVTINTPGIISDTNTINMTLKPNDLITTPFFVSSMEKMTPFMAVSSPQATSSTCTNRGKSNSNTGLGIHKSNNNDDSVTSINTNSGKPIIDLVMKYVTSKNFQQPQTTEFPLNTKDFTFNPSKSNKGFIYINNVYISNLNLKINK